MNITNPLGILTSTCMKLIIYWDILISAVRVNKSKRLEVGHTEQHEKVVLGLADLSVDLITVSVTLEITIMDKS